MFLKKRLQENPIHIFFLISIILSLFASFLSSLRVFLLDNIEHFFINWNILLSLVALFFAFIFYSWGKKEKKFFGWTLFFSAGIISFLFLPNSPYMITDSTHLSKDLAYRWYDSVLFFSAALSGVVVYANIIWVYWKVLQKYVHIFFVYVFVILTAFLSAFGIFLGRTYQILDNNGDRFNSWDLFFRPEILFEKVWDIIKNPFSYSELPMLFLGFSLILLLVSFMTIFIGTVVFKKEK